MSDYERECFMVQGFTSTNSTTSSTGASQTEFVQEGQQGKTQARPGKPHLIDIQTRIFQVWPMTLWSRVPQVASVMEGEVPRDPAQS